MGVKITPSGTFEAPSLKVLFSKLKFQVSILNQELKRVGADFQIDPKIFLDLKSEEFDLTQKVVLDPLQPYWAHGYKLIARSNILETLPFYKFVGRGGFPIGGIESASGLPRGMIEVEKISQDAKQKADLNARPNISDFLHDLGHLSAFIRSPEFAAAYVRVFRSQYYKIQKMDPGQRKSYLDTFKRPGTKEWRRNFYFSESAWLVNENYQLMLEKYPLLSSILASGKSFSSEQVANHLHHIDKAALMRELKKLKKEWWKLFNPMGGAVNDMISFDAFSPEVRSNFIVQKVLRELENFITADPLKENSNLSSLAIIFGFLKNSPRMTVTSWEYFARTDNWENSNVFKALQDIFPEQEIEKTSDWKTLFEFLYIR
ncbi:MAG: hypothetical protein KDD45_07895 [Bdellovibrionales bacterium]|nr:hypothetical protein [Bdellovibrionales bacterium]